jgi:hypothetical protein
LTDTDKRIAVVATILGEQWRQKHFDAHGMARDIVAALDQRELITKWEGARLKVVEDNKVVGCWIPHDDLLNYLNKLAGAPLTMADLRAKLRTLQNTYYGDPDPDLQADCLRVYRREQKAGTEFMAILDVIEDEVHNPVIQKQTKEHEQRKRDRDRKLVESGKDFGFVPNIDPNFDRSIDPYKGSDRYARYAGSTGELIARILH